MVEDLAVVPLVGEGHVLYVDAARHGPQLQSAGLVVQVGLQAHELHEAGQARDAVDEHLREAGEAAHGVDEGAGVQAEGDEVHVVHLAVHDEPPAHGDHRNGHDAGEKLHAAHEPAHGLVALLLGALEALVGALELGRLRVLVGEGLGRAHPGDAGFHVRVDAGHVGLHVLGGADHTNPVEVDDHQEHRDQDQHHQGKPPLDGEHDGNRAHQGHAGDEDVLRTVVSQLCDVEELSGDTAHEVAGAVFVVEAEGQRLQVVKEVLADIRLHQHAEGVAPVGDHVLQSGAQEVGGHHDHHHGEERLIPALRDQIVHAHPGDIGEGQVDEGDHQRAGHVQEEESQMGLEIAEKDAQQALFLKVFGRHESSSNIFSSLFPPLYHILFSDATGGFLIFSAKPGLWGRRSPPGCGVDIVLEPVSRPSSSCGSRSGQPPHLSGTARSGAPTSP